MEGRKIFIIPDTQCKPDIPVDHLLAAGRYLIDKQPDVVVMMGDWYDLPSLSSYEKPGSKSFEGKRYRDDVDAGNKSMKLFLAPMMEYNDSCSRHKKKQYKPRMVFLMGNHEHRLERAINDDPQKLDGIISYDDFDLDGWEVYPYMEIVDIEGILFSHDFANPYTIMKGSLTGTIDNRLQKIGSSFVQGHCQQILYGERHLPRAGGTSRSKRLIGIVCGAFYAHDEKYLGPQGNDHFRGCVALNDVRDGAGDIMLLSLEYLRRRYL